MANPDDKKAAGPTGGKDGKTDANPEGQEPRVTPQDPEYPKYKVRFGGPLVQNPQTVSGPHTLALLTTSSRVQIALTRNPADLGIPDLSITITELPDET